MSSLETQPSEELYRILGDRRRRYTLHYLKQQEQEVSVRDLAEQVAAWENGKSVEELSSQERKRVYISLYQSHLPTLDAEGIVEYDDDRKTVELTPAMVERELYLEIVSSGNVPWGVFYLGMGIAAAAFLGVLALDISPLNEISTLYWAGLIVGALTVSAGIHALQSRRMHLGDDGPPPDWQEPNSNAPIDVGDD